MESLKDNQEPVSESLFYMWRAIFALSHADHVVTSEEKRFMNRVLNDVNFTDSQVRVLQNDIDLPQDVSEMFVKISKPADRSRFFYYARMLLWCDGDFAAQEQKIMTKLGTLHSRTVDIAELIGEGDLRLESGEKSAIVEDMTGAKNDNILIRFLQRLRS